MQAQLKADLSALNSLNRVVGSIEAAGALRRVEEMAAGVLAENFLGSHDPDGNPWPPLKQPRPPGHNQGTRPLIDFGDLLQSVVSSGADHIERVSGDELVMGTKDRKAQWHQEGTGRIPARPFMGVNDKMADQAVVIVADDLIRQITG